MSSKDAVATATEPNSPTKDSQGDVATERAVVVAAKGEETKVPAGEEPGSGEGNDDDVDEMARILARRYYWRAISAGCLVIGSGLLFLSMNLRESNGRYSRRWSRR